MGKTLFNADALMGTKKHPHSRGEDVDIVDRECEWPETPPLTWGRPSWREIKGMQVRNTPTHVGKTQKCIHDCMTQKKHPHSRGEDFILKLQRSQKRETPPLTWGRRYLMRLHVDILGNTPTHVGKTGVPARPRRTV